MEDASPRLGMLRIFELKLIFLIDYWEIVNCERKLSFGVRPRTRREALWLEVKFNEEDFNCHFISLTQLENL